MFEESINKKKTKKQKDLAISINILQVVINEIPELSGIKLSFDGIEGSREVVLMECFKGVISEKFQDSFLARFSILCEETIKEMEKETGNTDK
jgi:hypothetical protein